MQAELFFGSLLWQIPSGSEDETVCYGSHGKGFDMGTCQNQSDHVRISLWSCFNLS